MKLKIYLDNKPNKSGNKIVRLSISHKGKRYMTSLGVSMSDAEFEALNNDFSGTRYNAKAAHKKHKEIIKLLSTIYDTLDWEFTKVSKGDGKLEDVDVIGIVNKLKGKEEHNDKSSTSYKVNELLLKYIEHERKTKDLSDSYIEIIYFFRNKINKFKNDLTLDEINSIKGISEFIEWNISEGLSNDSVKSQWAHLHMFLIWCYRNNLCSDEFKKYSFTLKSVDRNEKLILFLTIDEINKLYALDLKGNLEVIRDVFLLQCYTGLRLSDAWSLKKSQIKDRYITISMKKTKKFICNKLNKQALSILDKYIADKEDNEIIFPSLSKSCINASLKDIGKMAGLNDIVCKTIYKNHERIEMNLPKWQLLSSHVGRRSFIVNSLDLGLTPTQVRSYSGHSSLQAMEPYVSISQKKKDSAMDAWDSLEE